jgi:hypothetical protein
MSIDQMTAPGFMPFVIAAGVLLGLIGLEIIMVLLGAPLSHWFHLDHHAPPDHGIEYAGQPGSPADHVPPEPRGTFGTVLDWLNVGRVPIIILLMVILAVFAAAGIALQSILASILAPLPWPFAAVAALAAALPATRATSRVVARWLPRDETYSTSESELVGLTGEVTLGPARVGVVAKARFRDRHGNTHFTRVEPFEAGDTIDQGVVVLAVELRGRVLAVTRADPELVPERRA